MEWAPTLALPRLDEERRDVVFWTDRPIRSRIRRERDQLDRVREIPGLRSAGVGVQIALGLAAARLRQRHLDDGVAGPDADGVHRAARVGLHGVEGDLQAVLQSGRRPGPQIK